MYVSQEHEGVVTYSVDESYHIPVLLSTKPLFQLLSSVPGIPAMMLATYFAALLIPLSVAGAVPQITYDFVGHIPLTGAERAV